MPVLHRMMLSLLTALLLPVAALAQTFPQLTGPVVDQAEIIPPEVEARLVQKLTALKTQSQRELVVVTLPDLQGYDIADYGYKLGRAWQLGDKARDDGAILIVAPNERKLRIEVGYGLEPIMTDGLSSLIVNRAIVPKFKAGDMPGGIEAGTDAIIAQLQLPAEEAQKIAAQAEAKPASDGGIPFQVIIWLIIFVLFFVIPLIGRLRGGRRYGRGSSGIGQIILWEVLSAAARGSSGSGGGGSWGGGGGGSWGGGGGGFGGGGASGSW